VTRIIMEHSIQDMETVGPSATVPGMIVVEPRPAFAQINCEEMTDKRKRNRVIRLCDMKQQKRPLEVAMCRGWR
jgi:hypothetical protein